GHDNRRGQQELVEAQRTWLARTNLQESRSMALIQQGGYFSAQILLWMSPFMIAAQFVLRLRPPPTTLGCTRPNSMAVAANGTRPGTTSLGSIKSRQRTQRISGL